MSTNKLKLPTEVIELPSKGLLYSKDNPLSSGKIEMKYMTAREEDILTNQSYIQNGTMIDKLLQSLIITKFNYDDLLIGDKNAILIAARILGYGKDYEFTYKGENHTVDLTQLENKPFDESLFTQGLNEFSYTLPHTDTDITFRLLTHGDEKKIQSELKGLKKINQSNPEGSTRLKYILTSVGGNRELKDIREFVDNYLLAKDARELRNYIVKIQPDVDLTFFPDSGDGPLPLPIGPSFLYPDI
jgi:hypothetical protein